MPTFNPELKMTASCGPSLSTYQNEVQKGHVKVQMNGCVQHIECFQRKVNTPLFPAVSHSLQLNASDTSLLCTHGEDKDYREYSDTDVMKCVPHISQWATDPSSVPGNLRNSRVKSASQILQEFLNRSSSECDREIEGEKTELLPFAKVKTRKKPTKSQKQKTCRQTGPECIYSTTQAIFTAKTLNLQPKPAKNTRSSSLCPGVQGHTSVHKGLLLRGKVRSDLSVNVAPYSQKSSVVKSKDHHTSSHSNDTTRNKICKKSTNTSEYVNRRKTSEDNDPSKLKKVYLREKQAGKLSEYNDVVTHAPHAASKPENRTSCERAQQSQDGKAQQTNRRQMPKVEPKAGRKEKTLQEENIQAEKVAAREVKCELKRTQRREIYALNKVMTDLENNRFIQFMQNAEASI